MKCEVKGGENDKKVSKAFDGAHLSSVHPQLGKVGGPGVSEDNRSLVRELDEEFMMLDGFVEQKSLEFARGPQGLANGQSEAEVKGRFVLVVINSLDEYDGSGARDGGAASLAM